VINRTNTRRLAIALALGGVLVVSYPAVSGGPLWDVGAACGYVCLILFVCLYVFPVRGDGLPHARLLGLSQHKTIGWCVLAAGATHIAVVLLVEPQTGRYLLPSAPLFMWCGVVALLCAIALVVTGLSARSRATLHIVLAAVMMAAVCAHVIGSSQLLSGALKTGVGLFLLGLPLGWYALRRRPIRVTARRASHLVAVALIAVLPAATSKQHLLEPVTRPAAIEVNFPHDSHTSVNCVTCHHNYVDHSGTTACFECHHNTAKSPESTFHTFCRNCHTQLALDGTKHGPTRSCSACHQGMRSSRR